MTVGIFSKFTNCQLTDTRLRSISVLEQTTNKNYTRSTDTAKGFSQ